MPGAPGATDGPSISSGGAVEVEIYFSIIQRKVLTPNACATLTELTERIIAFGKRYSALNKPFAWRFTRQELERRWRDLDLQPELVTPLAKIA